MKELTLQDLDGGVIITMPDNSRYKLHRTNFILDISEWSEVLNKLQITLEGRPQPIIKEQENVMKKEFSKDGLKTGMLLTFSRGQKAIVLKDFNDKGDIMLYTTEDGWDYLSLLYDNLESDTDWLGNVVSIHRLHPYYVLSRTMEENSKLIWKREEKSPEQIAYEQLQAQIADEETRHNKSMKALREQADKLKPKQ